MNDHLIPVTVGQRRYQPFDLATWLSSPGRFNPTDIICGPGGGKSRLLGRVITYFALLLAWPQLVIDPTGACIQNLLDKLNRIGPDFERRWWDRYHHPLSAQWVHYVEAQLEVLVRRLLYLDLNHQGQFPVYYRLAHDDSLFDMAQRIVEVFRRLDPALETASIEGFNALYKLGTYTGMILSALGLQITQAEHLIRHPEQWLSRFDEALAAYPEVYPAVVFFREFITNKELRGRRADSLLTKLLAFTADPKLNVMFREGERSLNLQTVVETKQTVLLDFSHVHNADRRRLLMLWAFSEVTAFAKRRGVAGRQAPLGLVIDEITQLLSHQSSGQAIMAADLEELVSIIARNYGIMLTMAHQSLTQLEPKIQNALLQGNLMIGAVRNPDDARHLARYFFRYDPYWVKKKVPVWMGIASEPYYDPVPGPYYMGLPSTIKHVSTRTEPTIIDYRTEEFGLEEQLTLLAQEFQFLPRFQFLVHASGIEGQSAQLLQKLDISTIDPGIYPDEERVAEACHRLAAYHGFTQQPAPAQPPSLARMPPKRKHKKRKQPAPKPAPKDHDHDHSTNAPLTLSHEDRASTGSGPATRGALGSTSSDFWEPRPPTTASPHAP